MNIEGETALGRESGTCKGPEAGMFQEQKEAPRGGDRQSLLLWTSAGGDD